MSEIKRSLLDEVESLRAQLAAATERLELAEQLFAVQEGERDGLIAKLRDLTERADAYEKALREIRECMGGEDGTEGWDGPEDVWRIAVRALERSKS